MMRKFSSLLFASLVSVGFCTAASAAYDEYDITFSLAAGSSLAPTSGTFKYDAVAGEFHDFFVDWAGVLFDLTTSANAPSVTGTLPGCAASGGALSFQLLSQDACLASVTGAKFQWLGLTVVPGGPNPAKKAKFQFEWAAPPDNATINTGFVAYAGIARLNDKGEWSIEQTVDGGGGGAAVPEPATLALLGLGLAGLGLRRRLA